MQRTCEVKDDDDADSLASRVFEQECLAYPEAIRKLDQAEIRNTKKLFPKVLTPKNRSAFAKKNQI